MLSSQLFDYIADIRRNDNVRGLLVRIFLTWSAAFDQ